MSGIHPTSIPSIHAYTRSDAPWIIGEYKSAVYGKLIHYLSGGGMSAFGRTIHQELAARRHRRALAWLSALAALWLVFYFV